MNAKLDKFTMAYSKIIKEMNENKPLKRRKLIKEQADGEKYWKVMFGLQNPLNGAEYAELTYDEYQEDLEIMIGELGQYCIEKCEPSSGPGSDEWYEVTAYVPYGKLKDFLSIKTVGSFNDDDDIYTIIYSIDQRTPDELDNMTEEEIANSLNTIPESPAVELVDSAPAMKNAAENAFISNEEYKQAEKNWFGEE